MVYHPIVAHQEAMIEGPMADIIDEANDLQEFFLEKALRNQAKAPVLPFSGHCLSCDEPIEKGRYCDSLCREDHEQKLKRPR